MMGKSHLLLGAAGFLGVQAVAPHVVAPPLTTAELAAGTLVAAGAAMLPDIDHPSATLARMLGPVSKAVSEAVHMVAGGHRRGTHTIWAWAGMTALAYWALKLPAGPTVALCFAIFCSMCMLRVLTEADGLICLLLAGIMGGAAVLATGTSSMWMVEAIFIGYGLHLVGDVVTTEGIPPFWPLPPNIAIPILGSTDHWREKGAGILSGLVAFYLLVTTVFMPGWAAKTEAQAQAHHAKAASTQTVSAKKSSSKASSSKKSSSKKSSSKKSSSKKTSSSKKN